MSELSEIERQRLYYRESALEYERLHVRQDDEHYRALEWLAGVMNGRGLRSVLDVGAGTGRAVAYLKKHVSAAMVVGIEPSDGDGISYPYSLFDHIDMIREQFSAIFLINTTASSGNLYRTASHVALLAVRHS